MALIHHWKLDETSGLFYDSVGTAHGTRSGTVNAVTGLFGNAANFGTATSYVTCGDPADLDFGANPFTIAVWVKTTKATVSTLISKYGGGNSAYYFLLQADGKLKFAASDGGAFVYLTTVQALNDGLLHLIVIKRSGTTYTINVDGADVLVGTGPATILANSADFVIGNDAGYSNALTDGFQENVLVYDTALTQNEIDALLYAPTSTIYSANKNPANGASNIAVTTSPSFSILDSANQVDLTRTKIWVAGNLAYDNGEQAGYDITPVANGLGYDFPINPDLDFFEDYLVEVTFETYNAADHFLTETWTFDTETLEQFRNSGFEAPGASVGLARYWTSEIYDPGGFLGTKRGRVDNAIWTPPEGTHYLALGSTDLSEDMGAEPFVSTVFQNANLTDYNVLLCNYSFHTPTIPAGVTWTFRISLDRKIVLYELVLDSVRSNEQVTGILALDISGYNYKYDVYSDLMMNNGDVLLFDAGVQIYESFTDWPGIIIIWDDDLATPLLFGSGEEYESFTDWPE